ncbi:MAG: type ISP restriction/modification enzyme [Bacteroidota bacterium]
MSKILINQYYQNLDRTLQYGKSWNEQSIRNHFWALLNEYAGKFNYEVIAEVAVMGTKGKMVKPDGTVKNLWGLDIGLWESKDEKDHIEAEIDAKIKNGYPLVNILFEDSNVAVLFQRGVEVNRCKVRDAAKLNEILTDFFSFKSETVYKFEDAIEKFKADIPVIVETLRKKIVESRETNPDFLNAQLSFFELCKAEINPDVTLDDIREMMIQHILTSDIFNRIFDDPDFHRHNTIAAELEKLIGILFTYSERRNLLYSIEHYYEAINATAAAITDHHEKQKFLKVLYENFYKVYNPKAADRLGVVYTPNEIVQFMVQSANFLLHQHFGKTLADKNVEILDPATGTATFICEIIENVIPKDQLEYKYKHELHANEVAILPYYIAHLNIEYTFKQKMQYYAEFPNLCFVDTLDNTEALAYAGKQQDMFGMTSENTERIRRQNSKKISVFIGNPPYNSNQKNENENNKNREYPFIDKRISETFIRHSTAQKTKVYDMYSRFYRYAIDRMEKNGVIAFITNRSFIDSRTFDGFRKIIASEFNAVYIVDLGGDVRANPKLSGTKHMELHINYESVEPWRLERHDFEVKAEAKRQKEAFGAVEEPKEEFLRKPKIKVKLTADKTAGIIEIDELTFLSDVPAEAWKYKLGNRLALEWVLDQYKEKKPIDHTIAEKFNTYRFADYKEQAIDLLKRVCTVSVETMRIISEMER